MKHKKLRFDLARLMMKHSNIAPKEQLAVASYMVGQIVAHLSKRLLTPDEALDVVAHNIRLGNTDACADIRNGEFKKYGL